MLATAVRNGGILGSKIVPSVMIHDGMGSASNRLVREDPDDIMETEGDKPMSFGDAARRRSYTDRREQVRGEREITG